MNNWTDRATEEMIKYHAGVRVLCGLEESQDSCDRTSVEEFRNMIGPEGAVELNRVIVREAQRVGFTGTGICSSDTTVQEAPIAHPTEVGHLKNISEKLTGIGKKLKKKVQEKLSELAKKGKDIFNEIRLFTRGKKEEAVRRKKELSEKFHQTVSSMLNTVLAGLKSTSTGVKDKAGEQMKLYSQMLNQIIQWIKTGIHPKEKLISLWNTQARAIARDKAAKSVEFGRRWIISRLLGGYVIGQPCQKLGSDADVRIAEEVLVDFLDTFGEVPETFIYDRGGDGPHNHEILDGLGVENNCIFRKEGKMDITEDVFETARRERALSEASIATLKHAKYGFNKPRARTMDSCITKGFLAMFGSNLTKFSRDYCAANEMAQEVT
jgi:hypothetical protein